MEYKLGTDVEWKETMFYVKVMNNFFYCYLNGPGFPSYWNSCLYDLHLTVDTSM